MVVAAVGRRLVGSPADEGRGVPEAIALYETGLITDRYTHVEPTSKDAADAIEAAPGPAVDAAVDALEAV